MCNTYAVWLQYTVTCNSFRGASDVWYWIFVANFLSLIVARNGVTGNLGHSSVLPFFPGVLYRTPSSNPYGLTVTYKAYKLPGEEVKECFFQCTPLHSSWSSPHASHLPVWSRVELLAPEVISLKHMIKQLTLNKEIEIRLDRGNPFSCTRKKCNKNHWHQRNTAEVIQMFK